MYGCSFTKFSIWEITLWVSSIEEPVGIFILIVINPSSALGRNSEPILFKKIIPTKKKPSVIRTTIHRNFSDQRSVGLYGLIINAINPSASLETIPFLT